MERAADCVAFGHRAWSIKKSIASSELALDAKGALVLTVRYSFKTIEFEKGKAGIAVASKEKLIGVMDTLIAAVRAGELDAVLEQQGRSRGAPKAKRAA